MKGASTIYNENPLEHPVLSAIKAHMKFVSIHPFIDGNGRMARLLLNLILILNAYPPIVITIEKRQEYLNTIEEWQQNQNEWPFIQLIDEFCEESFKLYIETIEKDIIWK